MNKEDQISIYEFANKTGYSVTQVYRMGESGRIKIDNIAGKKSINKVDYPPSKFKKKIK